MPYLTNSSLLELDALPRHLVVVGGSYIGLEFAQIFRRFGAEVTVVEKAPRLIAREDEDVSDAIRAILEDEGIDDPHSAPNASASRRAADGIAVGVDCTAAAEVVRLACAAGGGPPAQHRRSRPRGRRRRDRRARLSSWSTTSSRTNVPGIWALGDCNGRGAFTHTSYNDYEIVAANLLDNAAPQGERPDRRLRALSSTRRSAASA